MEDILIVVIPSLIAIIVMVSLIKVTGLANLVVLEADTPVEETIAEHFEGVGIDRIVRSVDGSGALVYLKNTPGLVLVRALGDRMAVRVLNTAAIKSLNGDGNALTLILKDFTWPKMQLNFADEMIREAEENAINTAIKRTSHA